MKVYLLVGVGGMIGAILRYVLGLTTSYWWIYSFPLATLLANYIGSFMLAFLGQKWHKIKSIPTSLVTAINTGVIGSFTTFSTFSLETVQLVQANKWLPAFFYVLLSIFGGLFMANLGFRIGKSSNKKRRCKQMISYLLVAIGGFCGAIARYFLNEHIHSKKTSLPLATLAVNLVGSFLLGFLISLDLGTNTNLMLGIGFLGAFTTFSTFKVEILALVQKRNKLAYAYLFISYVGGILLAFLGLFLGSFTH